MSDLIFSKKGHLKGFFEKKAHFQTTLGERGGGGGGRRPPAPEGVHYKKQDESTEQITFKQHNSRKNSYFSNLDIV